LIAGVGIRAFRDLSRPEAWDYWKDQYVSPSLTLSLIASSISMALRRPARLFVSGTIGPAAANWFRDKLDEAHLATGDVIVLSSPGGDLIRPDHRRDHPVARPGHRVGIADASGRVKPSYCASACVLVFAGGKTPLRRAGLGAGRSPLCHDPSPSRPRRREPSGFAGAVLGYMTKMGVSSSIVEAMSRPGKFAGSPQGGAGDELSIHRSASAGPAMADYSPRRKT
jgi:hypothetical protein